MIDTSRTADQLHRRTDLLGTVVDVIVRDVEPDDGTKIAASVFEEIERLQAVFSVFDDGSELSRWRRGDAVPGPELAEVVVLAAMWRSRSRGVFDPGVGAAHALWNAANARGRLPDDGEITAARSTIRRGDPSHWGLNAIAKGWIVERAARIGHGGRASGSIVVNAGGDLVSLGERPAVVGIEHPRRPYDNVPPVSRVAVTDGALATSGNTRRGWRIDGAWYGHVIDPRTVWPVDHVASASVVADDAATADAVATILTVLSPGDGLSFATEWGVGCLVIDRDGAEHRNEAWRRAESVAATCAE